MMEETHVTGQYLSVRAEREGKWWVFEIAELTAPAPNGGRITAMGQSRSLKELDEDIRDVAALWTGVDEWKGEVSVTIELPSNVTAILAEADASDSRGREEIATAARLRRDAVRVLTAKEGIALSQAEAARALGLSPQRVSQLARRSPAHAEQ